MSKDSSPLKSAGLFSQIRNIAKKIPQGKVATYGQIARLVGISDSRKVGWALWGNQEPQIPCHRVIKKDGFLAKDYSLGGWEEQKARLQKEGITFKAENQVDLEKYQWVLSTK